MIPEARIAMMHGRQDNAERQDIMLAFEEGKIDLLVATTIVGIGIDVPDASLMVIENAERLGLAQLHQLRGRVGRSDTQSYCLLVYGSLSESGMQRLQALREHHDGYQIAMQDLKMRGPGEVLGTAQSGDLGYKIAKLHQDMDMVSSVSYYGKWLTQTNSEFASILMKRWCDSDEAYRNV
jgi:ATP-dependent DNA helicase RecG